MGRLEMLTTSAVLVGFNLRAAYYLGYSLLFGMCKSLNAVQVGSSFRLTASLAIWVTFVGGFIALKALRESKSLARPLKH